MFIWYDCIVSLVFGVNGSYQLGSNMLQAVDGLMTDNVVTMTQLKSSFDEHKKVSHTITGYNFELEHQSKVFPEPHGPTVQH